MLSVVRPTSSLPAVLFFVAAVVGVPASAAGQVAGWKPADPGDRVLDRDLYEGARSTIVAFREADPEMAAFFDQAHSYAIFPTVGKGGVGIGGAYGKGVLFHGGQAVGEVSLSQVTIGFQWGGQAYSEAIFFQSQADTERFTGGNFEVAAQASAVAATLGASRDVSYEGGVAIFTMAKGGLMYEASVGGQKFSFNPAAPPGS
jgi:lipid-binding SYLF domain-containing protein